MDFLSIVYVNKYLLELISNYHHYIYIILFILIFSETGILIASFPPGDMVVFLLGSLAAIGVLDIYWLTIAMVLGVFTGDSSSFFIGKFLGKKLFSNPNSTIFRHDVLQKVHNFYEHHGVKAIILARFVPVVRAFAPFSAGIGYMPYRKFVGFSFLASILWIFILLGAGFLAGNLPIVKHHFSLIVLVIIVMSVLSILPLIKMVYDEIKNIKQK